MPEDFYFAYGFNAEDNTALRLYRFVNGQFERFDSSTSKWKPDPDQCKIFIGEDTFYDEIPEETANRIKVIV